MEILADEQVRDVTLFNSLQDSSLKIEQKPLPFSAKFIACGTSTFNPKPLVPVSMRRNIFNHFHTLVAKLRQKIISERFVWPYMNSDIKRWTRFCITCQRTKIHRHTKSPPGNFATPDDRFRHLQVDLVGPLPEVHGHQYILTIIDRFSRWPVAIPLQSTTAESVAKAILRNWISFFGCPSVITTDRGPQFQSTLFKEFINLLGARHISTTAYHPCANGLVERFHRQLKAALTSSSANNQLSWMDNLPLVMLSLRSQVKEDLQCSPADLVFGQPLVLPGQFLSDSTASNPSSSFIQYLQSRMSTLAFTPTRFQTKDIFVPTFLNK